MNIPGTSISNIVDQDLSDWTALHLVHTARAKAFSFGDVDILPVVDCVHLPSWVRLLVDTIHCLRTPGKTAVAVVVELRAEDVVREFLETWLPGASRNRGLTWLDLAHALWLGQLGREA